MEYSHVESSSPVRSILEASVDFIRRHKTAFQALLVLLDALSVWVAFWLAYGLRYHWGLGGEVAWYDWRDFDAFSGRALLFAVLTVATLILRGAYRSPSWAPFLDVTGVVATSVTIAMAGVIFSAFVDQFVSSRLVFLYAWALAIALLLATRYLQRQLRLQLWRHDIGVMRVVVAGAGPTGRRAMQAIFRNPQRGLRMAGFVDDTFADTWLALGSERGIERTQRLGDLEDLEQVIQNHCVEEVILALPASSQDQTLQLGLVCREAGIRFRVVPDLLQLSLDRVELGEFSGVPLLGLRDASISGMNAVVKRGFDMLVATTLLALMAGPMALIAWGVRHESPGPVIFRQQRVGFRGQPFVLYKFRCMANDADQKRAELIARCPGCDPRLFKLANDPRTTRTGRFLRRWSLDELPQLFNVLRGDMTLVGPRPQLEEEVSGYEDWHRQRLLVAPGVTGLWQINGRSDLTFDEMVRLDLYYAEHWSLWLDLKILIRTIPAVLSGRGAY